MQYAQGYAELGLLREAQAELDAIDAADRSSLPVLTAVAAARWAAKQWEPLVTAARELVQLAPQEESAWIGWAFALRELGRIAEARAVLLDAEPRHGKSSAVLHYNLGCYYCLLGEMDAARQRLETAFRMHPPFKAEAANDADLEPLWGEFVRE